MTAAAIEYGSREQEIQGEELARIEKKFGTLVPAVVVAEARRRDSPLHDCFEWDDTKAAYEHRLTQARELIRSVSIRVESTPDKVVSVRAFPHVTDKSGVRTYKALDAVLSDSDYRAQMLAQALTELEGWSKRYAAYSELAGVFAQIEIVKTRLS